MDFRPIDRAHNYSSLALFLLVVIVYASTFPGHFFMDDVQIVKANNLVYQLNIKAIFTSDYWGAGFDSGLFRPLTILSLSMNRLIFGIDAWGYLLVNITLHVAVTAVLYLLLVNLGLALECAWLVAAVFAVHPVHCEPVIQLVGRSELLAALFSLLALYFSRNGQLSSDLATLGCYLLALLSKENGIVILAVVPLIDWFFARDLRKLLVSRYRLYLGMVLLTLLWLAYRHFVIHPNSIGNVIFNPNYVPLAFVDTGTRVLAAFKLQDLYIVNFLWPFQLQGIYPASTVLPAPSWLSWQGGVTVFVLALAGYGIVSGWRRQQLWALFALCYLLSFTPTGNFFFPAGFIMADRVAYTPSAWFIAMVVVALFALPSLQCRPGLKWGIMLLIVSYFTLAGVARARDFSSPEALWRRDLQVNPRNELARTFLAGELIRQERLAEAEEELKTAIASSPGYDEALATYAWLLVKTNRPEEGRKMALHAIATIKGRLSQAKIPLSLALTKLGRPVEALQVLQELRPPDRSSPWYWEAYGKALEEQGDLLGAFTCYQQEVNAVGPRSSDVFRRIGRLSLQFGNFADAVEVLRRDVQINPQSADAWNLLGVSLAQQGDGAAAEEAFTRAMAIDGSVVEYRANIERVRSRRGQ